MKIKQKCTELSLNLRCWVNPRIDAVNKSSCTWSNNQYRAYLLPVDKAFFITEQNGVTLRHSWCSCPHLWQRGRRCPLTVWRRWWCQRTHKADEWRPGERPETTPGSLSPPRPLCWGRRSTGSLWGGDFIMLVRLSCSCHLLSFCELARQNQKPQSELMTVTTVVARSHEKRQFNASFTRLMDKNGRLRADRFSQEEQVVIMESNE